MSESVKVRDLVPGQQARMLLTGGIATFVGRIDQHPIWPSLSMVIWKLDPNVPPGMSEWSHDALSPEQVINDVIPSTGAVREHNLRHALLGVTDG